MPKADLTLLQSSPIEIRELNLNAFRLALKNLEDDEAGIVFPTTHNHNPPVSVGGITLARVVEILPPYTITFESGTYAVNLAGGNSNIADRLNLNQTSVRSANSAGLVQTREIETAAYNGMVHLHTTEGSAGTLYPQGTAQSPVNNLADALLIAELRGFKTIHIMGDLTVQATEDISGYTIIGHDHHRSKITLADGSFAENALFNSIWVTGNLSAAGGVFHDCIIENVTMFNGNCVDCTLKGVIYVVGSSDVSFVSCFDGVNPGSAEINCGGTGRKIEVRDYFGGLKISNKTGSEELTINLTAGRLALAATVTGGTIVARGVGEVSENLGTVVPNVTGLVNAAYFGDILQSKLVEGTLSVKDTQRLALAMLTGLVTGAGSGTEHFRSLDDAKDRVTVTVDSAGNRSAITLDPT